jgi:hypothetical protein
MSKSVSPEDSACNLKINTDTSTFFVPPEDSTKVLLAYDAKNRGAIEVRVPNSCFTEQSEKDVFLKKLYCGLDTNQQKLLTNEAFSTAFVSHYTIFFIDDSIDEEKGSEVVKALKTEASKLEKEKEGCEVAIGRASHSPVGI